MSVIHGGAVAAASNATAKLSANQTITRADLAEFVHRKVGVSRADSALLVEMVIGEIVDALTAQEAVKLSSFGSFTLRPKNERLGRNPRTGIDAKISARTVVVFKASNIMRARINTPAMHNSTQGQASLRGPASAPSTSVGHSCS